MPSEPELGAFITSGYIPDPGPPPLRFYSVFFWLGLVGYVLVGCAIVGYWPAKA